MRFLFLVFDDPAVAATITDDDRRTYAGQFRAYTDRLRTAGVLVDAAGLDDADTATTVRPADGVITDGPYAEATEALGAFFHVDCADLDVALSYAHDVPVATGVTVEVRPTFT